MSLTLEHIVAALTRVPRDTLSLSPEGLRDSAVLVPLVDRPAEAGGLQVLLTRRANHLRHHAGQIAFPGGAREHADPDLATTAIRETYEEVGVPHSKIRLLGAMPGYQTVTGFIMHPYVAAVTPDYQMNIDRNEVDEAFEIPLAHLLSPGNRQLKHRHLDGVRREFYVIPYRQRVVWGATARVLVDLAGLLDFYD